MEHVKNRFIVGSTYFFEKYSDFNSKDIDIVILESNPTEYKIHRSLTLYNKKCIFEWKKMSADEFVRVTLETKLPMQVGKFLVPKFNEKIGFTIEHLKQLEPIFDKLDDKHLYEKIIYDAYIENNKFELNHEQRDRAYKVYKQYR